MDISLQLAAAVAGDDGGFHIGTLLLYVGGAIMLAFFCSLGLIARLRDNRIQERTDAAVAAAKARRAEVQAQTGQAQAAPDQRPPM